MFSVWEGWHPMSETPRGAGAERDREGAAERNGEWGQSLTLHLHHSFMLYQGRGSSLD